MKKRLYILIKIRFIVIFLIPCIFCWLFSCYGNDLMALFGLKWRPWVMKTFFIGFLSFKYIFLGSLAVKVVKWWHAKYIKKPSSAILGKVIYTNQTTYYITPNKESVEKIKRQH